MGQKEYCIHKTLWITKQGLSYQGLARPPRTAKEGSPTGSKELKELYLKIFPKIEMDRTNLYMVSLILLSSSAS